MFNRFIYIFFIFFTFFLFSPSNVNAIYDPLITKNNIYGMGIVNHSDLNDVNKLVNTNSGDWGYVTVVITEKDRNKEVWQKFLDDCRRLHLIPIIRVASEFDNGSWKEPQISEIDNWVNFFNSLNWVVENRYIIIGNEPNHAKEWGGKIDPESYSTYLKEFSIKLKNSNADYFVLNAGFDQDAPTQNSRVKNMATMDQKTYIQRMLKKEPEVFNYIDGWNSHSYPNPAFSGSKTDIGRRTIRGYEWETELLKSLGVNKEFPIFITETGWKKTSKNEELIAQNIEYAFKEVWSKNEKIVAVTPFILNYQQEPFKEFSWKEEKGFIKSYNNVKDIQKLKGEPKQKISGNIVFSFLNPLMFRNSEHKGVSMVKNTGQAIWTQSDAQVVNTNKNQEIKVSNTKLTPIEPFSSGLVVYTLTATDKIQSQQVNLGFYIKGQKIGDVFNGKIISF